MHPDAPSPLDLDHATMQRLGRLVADAVADHLATLREQPVIAGGLPLDVRRRVAAMPAESGEPFDALLDTLRRDVLPYAAREPHPGFMGYVPGCPSFPAVLGDWLATGYNVFAGVWPVAEGPNALELAVLEWFRAWIGMPPGTSGLLTNGGSGATLTAIVAARHAVVGDEAERLTRLTLYTSDQAHSAVPRAAWIAGVPRANVRVLPTDDAFRLRVDALRAAVAADRAAGLLPFAVVATAGTTNTGAVDPLHEIADLCAAEELWLHADAAYGGFAALTERGRALLDGLGRCDSVALDPHKWLFVPFECGCLLAREPARLRDAFHIMPDYLRDVAPGEERVNFADYGEQLTRQSRALKVWLGVRYFGLAALRAEMDRAMDLVTHAESLVRAEPSLEVTAPARLGVLCFRVRGPHALNQRVNARVNAGGKYLVSSTRLRGTFTLRLCVLGYRTTRADVEGLIRAVVEAAK
ncbi:Pyridoxal-dependent decarboxylase [Gemmatirosa kalamazoonensis]|uniref:Pyridoxal-dependent decarboxylase n=1 Tax=Gemmatirosa kalamazoonensis TaxID=861299 RepID=W0RG41_9BACT|nr:aminotransferase class I/II-fold pyridoxal phosphate-dependent enzyme [Gemmatirosa kalamazoonensis]AHG88363.1 Pyridoxal-dependent decarboxylase [Gemmatirosa kalamazoonensis]